MIEPSFSSLIGAVLSTLSGTCIAIVERKKAQPTPPSAKKVTDSIEVSLASEPSGARSSPPGDEPLPLGLVIMLSKPDMAQSEIQSTTLLVAPSDAFKAHTRLLIILEKHVYGLPLMFATISCL